MKRFLFTALALLLAGARLSAAAPERIDEAIRRGTGYLLGQQKENGSITDKGHPAALTSLAVMALLAIGTTPDDPTDEGRALEKALAFMLEPERQKPDGYFGGDGSRMYGHGIVTLMLAEVAGMSSDAEQDAVVRERLEKAIGLILLAQKARKHKEAEGGWRYTPEAADSDMSVTVWQTMALRAANNAGIDTPKEAIDAAADYIRRSFRDVTNKEDGAEKLGVFLYEAKGGGSRDHRHISTTAEGLLALQVCGEYDAPEVVAAANFLRKYPPTWERKEWFFYGAYYFAQGMHQRGGSDAEKAQSHIAGVLLAHQSKDGSWEGEHDGERGAGRVYATSLALLGLAVKHHYLPIYQR